MTARDLPSDHGAGGPAIRHSSSLPLAVALLAVRLFCPLAPPVDAQVPDSPRTEEARQRALKRAHAAQEDFENLRRRNLPRNTTWGLGECDATVGRMCWRYHSTLGWHPREEPPEVTEARDALLRDLEAAALSGPGDDWILGQRVRYLAEAGRMEEARTLAERCGTASLWWCRALEGLVLHLQGRYPEAGRAFDLALQAMDPAEARGWEDPSPLLDRETRNTLEQAAEADSVAGTALVDRLWRLADPFYLVPGNDRRTEHLARHTVAELFSDAAHPHRLAWGSDMAELLLRYGWELGWERRPPRPGELGAGVDVVGFESPDVRVFFPPAAILAEPGRPRVDAWVPSMWPSARSGYAPAYAPVFLPMASRLLVFTRGDRALVGATFRLPPDTTYRTREGLRGLHVPPGAFRGWPLRGGLILDEISDSILHASVRDGATEGVLLLEVPSGDYQASVEVLDPAAGVAGRYRNGLPVREVPPDLPVLSELLLLRDDSLPETTTEALERLRISDRTAIGEPLVVGWELWGLGWREEMVRYRLKLEPAAPGLLERFRRLFGGQSRFPILEWEEPAPDEPGPAFQSVSVTPPGLEPGDYRLRLEVGLMGRNPMVSEMIVHVAEPRSGQGTPGT